jgi:hypothetical protein
MADTIASETSNSMPRVRPFVPLNANKGGQDSFIFANGEKYIGDYTITNEGQLMRHGQGKHISADEHLVYEGTWHHDKMHGSGRLTFGNGSAYDGEFQSNYFQGIGTYTWSDGSQYTGTWQRSKPIGPAEYITPDLGVPFIGVADGHQINMRYKISSA